MALCAHGSEPKAGSPPYVWVTWLDAKAWLGTFWGVFSWAGIATHAVLQEVATFCATEPVQPSPPSDATIVAASHDPVAFEALLTYIEQSAIWWVWHNVCVCSAASAGTCYPFFPHTTLPNTSGDYINQQFGIDCYPLISGLSCYGASIRFQAVGAGTFRLEWSDTFAGTTHHEDFAGVAGQHDYIFASPPTFGTHGGNPPYYLAAQFPNSGYHIYENGVNATPADTTAAHYFGCTYGAYPGSVSRDSPKVRSFDPLFCTSPGPAPAPSTPPAPSVPGTSLPALPILTCGGNDLCELLQELQLSVSHNRLMIDLVQRQNAPFGYVTGTVHSGLSGTGSIAVSDILGLLAQVSTVPGHWGRSADNPSRYIPSPLTVAVGTSAGNQDTHFVHFAEEMWFPDAMGAMTIVDYHFPPGCGGAITELVREP